MTEPSRQLAEKGRQRQISGSLETFSDLSSGLVLVKGSLSIQLGHSYVHPGPAEVARNCGSLVAPQVTQGQSKAMSNTGLHQSSS